MKIAPIINILYNNIASLSSKNDGDSSRLVFEEGMEKLVFCTSFAVSDLLLFMIYSCFNCSWLVLEI